MKFNQILPVIAIYVVALGGCSNTTPDYSEFYKDPETLKEEDPSLNDNQIKVMSFNIRYYNTKDTRIYQAAIVHKDTHIYLCSFYIYTRISFCAILSLSR